MVRRPPIHGTGKRFADSLTRPTNRRRRSSATSARRQSKSAAEVGKRLHLRASAVS
jgi:hypothetical protein